MARAGADSAKYSTIDRREKVERKVRARTSRKSRCSVSEIRWVWLRRAELRDASVLAAFCVFWAGIDQ
jgi:hypothetical protein